MEEGMEYEETFFTSVKNSFKGMFSSGAKFIVCTPLDSTKEFFDNARQSKRSFIVLSLGFLMMATLFAIMCDTEGKDALNSAFKSTLIIVPYCLILILMAINGFSLWKREITVAKSILWNFILISVAFIMGHLSAGGSAGKIAENISPSYANVLQWMYSNIFVSPMIIQFSAISLILIMLIKQGVLILALYNTGR